MAQNPGATSDSDPDGRLLAPYYGNQPNLFEIRARDFRVAARLAAVEGFWLGAWNWVPADHDEPVITVVGEPNPPWTSNGRS